MIEKDTSRGLKMLVNIEQIRVKSLTALHINEGGRERRPLQSHSFWHAAASGGRANGASGHLAAGITH